MNKLIAAAVAALFVTMAVTAYSDNIQSDLQTNLVRLHIVADSDSDSDQAVKLKVRDAVLADVNLNPSTDSRHEIIGNLGRIEETANAVLKENGFTYTAHAEYGKFDFPRKTYKSITLPAGEYYGVRVTLGSGSGHNWWCVMYPPLCFTESGEATLSADGEKLLRSKLGPEAYDVINSDGNITVKLKIVELAQQVICAAKQNNQ